MTFEQFRRIRMYENGAPAAEIADTECVTAGTILSRMREQTPQAYEQAKRNLAEARNAKYRRVGALAVDIQLDTLEAYAKVLAGDDEQAKNAIRSRLKDIAAIGEQAEKRVDLNEGRATERTEHKGGIQIVVFGNENKGDTEQAIS